MSLTDVSLNVPTINSSTLHISGSDFKKDYRINARKQLVNKVCYLIDQNSSSTIQAVPDNDGERVKISYKVINEDNITVVKDNYLAFTASKEIGVDYPETSTWGYSNPFIGDIYFPVVLGHVGTVTYNSHTWWQSSRLRFDIAGGVGKNVSGAAGGQASLYARRNQNTNKHYIWIQGTTRDTTAEYSSCETGTASFGGESHGGKSESDETTVKVVSTFGTTTGSDKRLKENILPIKNALKAIKKVNIIEYNLIHKYSYPSIIGIIAQELKETKEPLLMRAVEIPEYLEEPRYCVIEYTLFSTNIKALQEFNQDFIKDKKETIEMLNILDEKLNILENK